MRLYLDEDIASGLLVKLLMQARHDVQIPSDVGMLGSSDPLQLVHAIRDLRPLLSYNLHLLIRESQGHHSGVVVVRREDDPKKNMSPRDVVKALRNLEAAGAPLADEYCVLNHWR